MPIAGFALGSLGGVIRYCASSNCTTNYKIAVHAEDSDWAAQTYCFGPFIAIQRTAEISEERGYSREYSPKLPTTRTVLVVRDGKFAVYNVILL